MRKSNPKTTNPPHKIWEWLWDTLEQISDEVGAEENGEYLLAYEGWGCACVSGVFDTRKTDEENEDKLFEYAEERAGDVIEEWRDEYEETHYLIDCGHEPTGLYGVTWALFKRRKRRR